MEEREKWHMEMNMIKLLSNVTQLESVEHIESAAKSSTCVSNKVYKQNLNDGNEEKYEHRNRMKRKRATTQKRIH